MDDNYSDLSIKSEEDEDPQLIDNDYNSMFNGSFNKDNDNETKTQELYELLQNWNQLELFEHFKNEKIDLEVLAVIKPHYFERLLAPFTLGTHIMFEHNLEQWRNSIGFPLPRHRDTTSMFEPYRYDKISSLRPLQHTIVSSPPTASPAVSSSFKEISPITQNPETASQTRITLETILKTSPKGQMLVEIYKKNQKFKEAHRTLLIHLIAEYFNDKGIHLELAATYSIEREIISKFPSEQLEFYRTSKRGRIYNKYCNYKYSLIKVNRNSNVKVSTAGVPNVAEPISELVPEQGAEVYVTSLKYDNLSAEQFETSWKLCTRYRINEIRALNSSIPLIFTKWPQYKSPLGNKYIAMDFQYLHSNWNSLVTNWDTAAEKLLQFLSTGHCIKSHEIRTVLRNIKNTESKNCRDAALLWCLHGYLKPTNTICGTDEKGNRSMSKVSIKESQDSFVYVAKSVEDIEIHRQILNQQYTSFYPFIAVLGTDILNFSQIFVCVEDAKYSLENFVNAVDLCYNLIILFKLEYPTACKAIWSFIQNYFFEIKPETRFPRVHVLINELKDK
ncbi:uncharacterized protein LOC129920869 [Episyrphus balteatus]|uniref:uncharacterized protein LOC129920869 n=1 Tax=Episyrphus balteatus TaxID=286459 RepID=UPI002484EDCA|nr:uncharacterized protein LOC129920869 [Episyrphus balteatus]